MAVMAYASCMRAPARPVCVLKSPFKYRGPNSFFFVGIRAAIHLLSWKSWSFLQSMHTLFAGWHLHACIIPFNRLSRHSRPPAGARAHSGGGEHGPPFHLKQLCCPPGGALFSLWGRRARPPLPLKAVVLPTWGSLVLTLGEASTTPPSI